MAIAAKDEKPSLWIDIGVQVFRLEFNFVKRLLDSLNGFFKALQILRKFGVLVSLFCHNQKPPSYNNNIIHMINAVNVTVTSLFQINQL